MRSATLALAALIVVGFVARWTVAQEPVPFFSPNAISYCPPGQPCPYPYGGGYPSYPGYGPPSGAPYLPQQGQPGTTPGMGAGTGQQGAGQQAPNLDLAQSSGGTSAPMTNTIAMIGDQGPASFGGGIGGFGGIQGGAGTPTVGTGLGLGGGGGTGVTASSPPRFSLATRGSFKIVENESPRPQDRVFGTYNFFSNVDNPGGGKFDAHRETVGFEKTLFNDNFSFGLRVPLLQTTGLAGGQQHFGDISVIFKYALINSTESGNVLSGGLLVNTPTGGGIATGNTTLLEPFAGFIYNADNWFVQGFSAVAVPVDSAQTTFLFNSVGLVYWLYRDGDGWLKYIAPTIEGHLTDPLNNRLHSGSPFAFPDVFDLTVGSHFGLLKRLDVTVGFVTPLTGPKPFQFEYLTYVNWRF